MDYRLPKIVIIAVFCSLAVSLWAAPQVVVRDEAVSLRTEIAGDKYGVLVQSGQRLTVLNKFGRWYYVKTSEENVGWIFDELVQLDLNTYAPADTDFLTPQEIYALATRKIVAGGQVLDYQWTGDGEHVVFLYRSDDGEYVVRNAESSIDSELVSAVFSTPFVSPGFLPDKQKLFNGGMSLSPDGRELLVGGPILNLLFLDENFEIQRRERIKVRTDDELYGGVSFSPRGNRAIVYNLVAEELDGMVDNLCLISARGDDYEIITKTSLDWTEPPNWAPDGFSFLFGSNDKIFMVDYELRVKEFAVGRHFSFSPDGEQIAFNRNKRIYLQALKAASPREKTFGRHPDWHPGGSKLAYENQGGVWIIDVEKPEKKRLLATADRPLWAPGGDKLICQTSPQTLVIVYLAKVLDINYTYRLDLGERDGLATGMLLSVYRPQTGLKDQTVGYNQESWQGFIRVISARPDTALVKQEKMTRVIGREEVVVLPSLKKIGRLVRVTDHLELASNKTAYP